MAITTDIKDAFNAALRSINVKIDTLTGERNEVDRIRRQISIGQFDRPVFPLLDGMASFDGKRLANTYAACRADIDRMMNGAPPADFDRSNTFYNSPDAEVPLF